MEEKVQDYLFDLQGYLVLEGAICNEDLQLINQWIDDHWEYIETVSYTHLTLPTNREV